jgi:ADP-heptose:LPS heptosyltransferase
MSRGKKIETGFKNFTSAILIFFLKQPKINPTPPYSRILFLRYGHLGDMILSLPLFRAVRAKYPDIQIDVICDLKNANPLEENPIVDNVYFYEKNIFRIIRLILKLRKKKYGYICNLVAYPSFTFGILARLIGPKAVRAAGDQEQFNYLYNRLIELPPKMETHMLKRLFLLSSDITGEEISHIETPWITIDKVVEEKANILYKKISSQLNSNNPRLVLVNLSAGMVRHEWQQEKYIEFLQTAVSKFKTKIDCWAIITDPKKPRNAAQLVEKLNHISVVQVPVQDDFRIMMALMRKCILIITPDTSFSHAASAMGTPVLNLMTGENIITWAPYGVRYKIVSSDDLLTLKELQVESVLQGFDELLEIISLS